LESKHYKTVIKQGVEVSFKNDALIFEVPEEQKSSGMNLLKRP